MLGSLLILWLEDLPFLLMLFKGQMLPLYKLLLSIKYKFLIFYIFKKEEEVCVTLSDAMNN